MDCLAFICGGRPAAKALGVVQKEQAAVDAACKLIANFEKVVQDITNEGPLGLGGGQITQVELKRVDPKDISHVRAMVKGVCSILLGKVLPKMPTPEEALVWNQAARFLGSRIQGSPEDCPGREADMSQAAATAMCKALGQVEVGCKLISNRERVVNDITNPDPEPKSQQDLKRVDSKHNASVDEFVREVYSRLLGKPKTDVPAAGKPMVWAEAAKFLAARIQEPSDFAACQRAGFRDRKADMTPAAAMALRTILGQVEAGLLLTSNRETVVKDITNPGPQAVRGGEMTQPDLKRLSSQHKDSVDNMVKAVAMRLLGEGGSAPSTLEEAQAWAGAAVFLSKRIQSRPDECDGRKADMSPNAAKEMRTVLAQTEAASKLISNRDTVVQDITNAGPLAVRGGQLTQLNLMRVDKKHKASVDAMVQQLWSGLLGGSISSPTPAEARIWTQAANFFNGRIQAYAEECYGREPDMSYTAAAEMRVMLAQITNQTNTIPALSTALTSALGQV